ncbi:hypothetical protein [Parafrankia sp. EUN1f]|uniref:hypothetical protein n=1 Tax=Parafrankia sp. EUN1f TaxID=102897 RepID=UPI0001C45F0B|nr:hypothetical protein [Parafrankia sp. EUN1f]EFC81787.1 hypothetical protein FrEUN1fDRAFT_5110 [Parafrankia sp. EUN1f]
MTETTPSVTRVGRSDDAERTVAAAYRAYVMTLLEQDAEYDERPEGDPPLLVSDYRRALFALLERDPVPLLMAGRGVVTPGEAMAFMAGQRAALDAVAVAIGEAWRPGLLAGRRGRWMHRLRSDRHDTADKG